MVSRFGSLGYTIMGKTADLTVVQKTIIDKPFTRRVRHNIHCQRSFHRVLYPSMLTESWVEEKDAQPTERTAALWGLSSKINSRIWGELHKEWTEAGVKNQEAPHTDVSRNLATVVFRDVLPWLREEELDCCPVGSMSSFQMRAVCISFRNQGPRVWRKGGEAQSPSCLKSSVKFPQSVMIWVQCHLLLLVPLCFNENQHH